MFELNGTQLPDNLQAKLSPIIASGKPVQVGPTSLGVGCPNCGGNGKIVVRWGIEQRMSRSCALTEAVTWFNDLPWIVGIAVVPCPVCGSKHDLQDYLWRGCGLLP